MRASLMPTSVKLDELVDLLLVHADRHVIFYDKLHTLQIKFSELHRRIIETAAMAVSSGMRKGDCVGVIAENGYDALLIDLVLLKLGCTTIQLPEGAALDMLKTVGGHRLDWIAATAPYRHIVDRDQRYIASRDLSGLTLFRKADAADPSDIDLTSTSAVVFSSGTSGKVKKIRVNNDGVVYNANVFFSAFGPQQGDTFLLFLPLSNYQQKLLTYGCILWGVNICLTNAVNVLSALKSTSPTLFLAPPVFYEAAWKLTHKMVEGEKRTLAEKLRAYFGGKMRIMWSGMAPIAPEILQNVQAAGIPLLEAYGMTEYGPITSNRPARNKIGSVGVPLVEGSVQINPDGEIMVQSPHLLTTGYVDEPHDEEAKVYLDAHRIATGDLGHFDDDGFLFIRGRKKEIIVTSSGYKIHPQSVEGIFHSLPFVTHAILMGKDQPHLGLLVIVAAIEPGMDAQIAVKIGEVNAGICQASPIRKWSLQADVFSPENGLLTRNLKLHRENILDKYREAVFS